MAEDRAGTTLQTRLDASGRLPLGEGLSVLDELLRLVGEMHRSGAVHGALTAAHVVLGEAGRVAVMPPDPAGGPGQPDAYRSPQLLRGDAPDARADVYALGVIAYLTLTGALPYQDEQAAEPLDPGASLPGLVDHVRRSLVIAVQPNLTERFADALTFRAALRGDSDLALSSPTLKWAIAEGIPEGDTGAAEEFAGEPEDDERAPED